MQDTFGLNESQLGLTTLSTVVGEVIGLSVMTAVAHRGALWFSAIGTLTHQFIVSAGLFAMSVIYGNNITLYGALIFITFLTMGHESFYVVQQSNAIKYVPTDLAFMLLLAERMAQEIGSVVALVISAMIWNRMDANALLVFSVIWLGSVLLECIVLFIYPEESSKRRLDDEEEYERASTSPPPLPL